MAFKKNVDSKKAANKHNEIGSLF